ncbi:MAG TPA: porin family protein [Bacteroidales bacterium]|nr:porin family protein [Bacteroidales bacterium]
MKLKATSVLFVLVFFIGSEMNAQKKKPQNKSWYDDKYMHYGFTIGFNTMDFLSTPSQFSSQSDSLYPEVTSLKPGINIQIVTNGRLSDHFDIRFLPGVSFGQRTINFYRNKVLYNDKQRLESSFLEFPLILKFKGDRLNNVRPYVIAGLNYRYDLAAKKEYDDEKAVYIRLKKPDLYIETGAGMDFYLTYFKLSIEAKLSGGLTDVLVQEPAPGHAEFYNAIAKLRSQIWVLSFHFE